MKMVKHSRLQSSVLSQTETQFILNTLLLQ